MIPVAQARSGPDRGAWLTDGFEAPGVACHGWIGAAGAQGEGPKEIDKENDLESDALINLATLAATGSPNRIRQVGAAIFTCDGGEPITIRAARHVADILRHVPAGTQPLASYSFYM